MIWFGNTPSLSQDWLVEVVHISFVMLYYRGMLREVLWMYGGLPSTSLNRGGLLFLLHGEGKNDASETISFAGCTSTWSSTTGKSPLRRTSYLVYRSVLHCREGYVGITPDDCISQHKRRNSISASAPSEPYFRKTVSNLPPLLVDAYSNLTNPRDFQHL